MKFLLLVAFDIWILWKFKKSNYLSLEEKNVTQIIFYFLWLLKVLMPFSCSRFQVTGQGNEEIDTMRVLSTKYEVCYTNYGFTMITMIKI